MPCCGQPHAHVVLAEGRCHHREHRQCHGQYQYLAVVCTVGGNVGYHGALWVVCTHVYGERFEIYELDDQLILI